MGDGPECAWDKKHSQVFYKFNFDCEYATIGVGSFKQIVSMWWDHDNTVHEDAVTMWYRNTDCTGLGRAVQTKPLSTCVFEEKATKRILCFDEKCETTATVG